MANFTFTANGTIPAINLVTSGQALINLLNNYNRVEFTSSEFELSTNNDSSNQTEFSGSGLTYDTSPKLSITGGTITEIEINVGGFQEIVEITGLTMDGEDFGDELSAASKKLWEFILSGDDTIIGDDGDDVLRGFDGTDTVTGGDGADDFAYFAGDDVLIITDFQPGEDQLGFGDLGEDFELEDLIPFVSQVGDDVEIRAGDAAVIIQDTDLSDLSGDDVFFFV